MEPPDADAYFGKVLRDAAKGIRLSRAQALKTYFLFLELRHKVEIHFYGKDGVLTGTDRENQEVSMLALHLLQSALVFVNTILVQSVLADPEWAGKLTDADRRALPPLFWSHANLYGTIEIDMDLEFGLAA
jgi:hypothetical protein